MPENLKNCDLKQGLQPLPINSLQAGKFFMILLSADFFIYIDFFENILSGKPSEIQIKPDSKTVVGSDLVTTTVGKGYQHTTELVTGQAKFFFLTFL